MKIETMRKIDYAVGIPLTFLLSLLKGILPARKTLLGQKRKVLFIELSEMGSAILADPAMQRTQNLYQAEVFFVIFKRNKASLNFLKSVKEENIFTITDTSLLSIIKDSIKFIFWCQHNNIDTSIDLELFSRATAVLSFVSRCPIKVGFHNYHGEGLYRGSFLNRNVSYNPHIHISKNFISLVDAAFSNDAQVPFLKQKISDEDIKIRKVSISEDLRDKTLQSIKKVYPAYHNDQNIVLVNPNASEFLPQRKWPIKNYIDLIKLILQKHPNHLVLMTGSPQEHAEIQTIEDAVGSNRCRNFAGHIGFNDLVGLYSLSKVLITNDSGPGHFSSVTNIRSYVFFGPETPLLYGSLGNSSALYAHYACSPCVSAYNHRKTPCTDNKCLQVLSPDWVYREIQSSL